jgi:hypothetical protein
LSAGGVPPIAEACSPAYTAAGAPRTMRLTQIVVTLLMKLFSSSIPLLIFFSGHNARFDSGEKNNSGPER